MILYENYRLSFMEKIEIIGKCLLRIILLAYFFYGAIWVGILLSPVFLLFYKEEKEKKKKKRLWSLNLEFRELLLILSSLLQAGYSVEKALILAKDDLEMLFGNTSNLVRELNHMESALQNNLTLDELLQELSQRSGLEDISEFYSVFSIAKKQGGNMNHILRYGAEKISEKIHIKEEIQLMVSARSYELKLMTLLPFLIVCYISITNPGYFQVLYHNSIGILIMSICLLLYLVSYAIGHKILSIQI